MPVGRQRLYSTAPANTSFTYRLAAASIGKHTLPRPPKINRDFWNYASTGNSTTQYLRSTKRDAGEDAFFATVVGGSPNAVAFGLADGVGGWQDQGVDPSRYSHGLCAVMVDSAHHHEGEQQLRPRDLLQNAYEAVTKDPRIPAGGCTASLAVADGNGELETANLGDSGFLIMEPGKISARSRAQTHEFNTPYQLAKIPQRMQAQYAIFGGGAQHHSETPAHADVANHKLKHGDIVLFGTDGVWDNLSAQDTLSTVTKIMEEQGLWSKSQDVAGGETTLNTSGISRIESDPTEQDAERYVPGLIARAVMREAKLAGLDRKRNGPFAKEVKLRYPNEMWQGGKPDDIAVVVAIAIDSTQNGAPRAKL